MIVERIIMPERGLAYFRMSGKLFTAECVTAFMDYTKDPMFNPNLTMLTNAEGLRGLNTNFVEVVRAAGEIREAMGLFKTPVPSVLYCTSNAAFGMARVMQQVVEPMSKFQFKITKDPAEALRAAGQAESDFGALDSALAIQAAG